jgi:hypothetical protein
MSRDEKFLSTTLASVCKVDPFYAKLMHIYSTVRSEPVVQPVALGINRSDYMLELAPTSTPTHPKYQVKQVELNTISAAGSCMSANTSRLHRYLMARYLPDVYDPDCVRVSCVSGSPNICVPLCWFIHSHFAMAGKQCAGVSESCHRNGGASASCHVLAGAAGAVPKVVRRSDRL